MLRQTESLVWPGSRAAVFPAELGEMPEWETKDRFTNDFFSTSEDFASKFLVALPGPEQSPSQALTIKDAVLEYSSLPDIFALTIFIVCFRPLVRRVGPHVDLWFLGWTFVLVHHIALMIVPTHGWTAILTQLTAIWSSGLCGMAFLLGTANVPKRQIGKALASEFLVPTLVSATLVVYPHDAHWMDFGAALLFLAPAVHVGVRKRTRTRPVLLFSSVFGVFGLCVLPHAWRHLELTAHGAISLLFLGAGYFYLKSAERYTRGVIAAVTGLFGWGLSFPIVELLRRTAPEVHVNRAVLELPQYLIVAGIILTLLQEHMQRTERMAMHDPLTDLPNRRLFEERLIATLDEARENCTTIACLVIDVDNFKTINDTLGHSAGDQLLRALAVRLSWHMSPRDMLARTGGDEFTALLAGVNDEHHLRFIASAMMSAGSVPIAIDGQSVDIRISIGIALSPDHADDIDSLRRAADQAMYSAKRRGGAMLAFAGED